MTGSPISDLNPIFMAANVELFVQNTDSSRVVTMNHEFFTGYRRNVVKADEMLVAILIPYTKEVRKKKGCRYSKLRLKYRIQ